MKKALADDNMKKALDDAFTIMTVCDGDFALQIEGMRTPYTVQDLIDKYNYYTSLIEY